MMYMYNHYVFSSTLKLSRSLIRESYIRHFTTIFFRRLRCNLRGTGLLKLAQVKGTLTLGNKVPGNIL